MKHGQYSLLHPLSYGAVEHVVPTFIQAMKIGKHDRLSIGHQLENLLMSYLTTTHAATRVPPWDLFLGRCNRTRPDLVKPDLPKNVNHKLAVQKAHHELHVKARVLDVGQRVMGPNWEKVRSGYLEIYLSRRMLQ